MCGGGVLSYLVLIPMIKFFGEHLQGPLAPGKMPIADMEPDDVRAAYILYIGSGAVAAGGIISLFRSLPTIWHGLKEGLRDVGFLKLDRARGGSGRGAADRAGPLHEVRRHRDHRAHRGRSWPPRCSSTSGSARSLLGAILIVVFGFLFVTVSSRLTGEIGSSSNPISGHDDRDAPADLPHLPRRRLDRERLLRHGALGRRHRLHRGLQRREHVPGPEDGLHPRGDATVPPGRHPHRLLRLGARAWADAAGAQQRKGRVRPHRRGGPRGPPCGCGGS